MCVCVGRGGLNFLRGELAHTFFGGADRGTYIFLEYMEGSYFLLSFGAINFFRPKKNLLGKKFGTKRSFFLQVFQCTKISFDQIFFDKNKTFLF